MGGLIRGDRGRIQGHRGLVAPGGSMSGVPIVLGTDCPSGNMIPESIISTFSVEMGFGWTAQEMVVRGLVNSSITTANLANFHPFVLAGSYTAQRMWWQNTAALAGNVDAGIYAADGTRLGSIGSTAQAGASVVQSAALTAPVSLSADTLYYLAFVGNNTGTGLLVENFQAQLDGTGAVFGLLEMAAAFPLPATATFTAPSSTQRPILFGITNRTTF